ncbi:hypothetical protein CYMTET_28069 [Cymbomonas tetramitiformis]|uniref:Uncharacterized protein n=1 Tax=Cymbomonas tetramitiformis TaxID=36881 RepID=A0AAE0FNQ6_9CHLO|nr:hypothetical protein CYMTET_28069 [Cymbomonas tetramitiformis]
MGFAILTFITYVFGYPLSVYLAMYHHRRFQRVRMDRKVAEMHIDLLLAGYWVPCATDDVSVFRRAALNSALNVPGSLPGHKAQSGALSGGEDSGTGSENGEQEGAEAVGEQEGAEAVGEQSAAGNRRITICAQRSRNTTLENTPIDLYLRCDMFVRIKGTKNKANVEAAQEMMRQGSARVTGIPRKRNRQSILRAGSQGRHNKGMTDTILLADGRIIDGVRCLERPDVGDYGVITQVPVTRLNDADVDKVKTARLPTRHAKCLLLLLGGLGKYSLRSKLFFLF